MNLCALYSGGKDSNLALLKASKDHKIACLLSLRPNSEESELFHYPNIDVTEMQAKVLGIPLIKEYCPDGEEESLKALKRGLKKAIKKFDVDGVVTGAIRSVYQATRFQKVCSELDIWCFNPLWLRDEISILKEIINLGFKCLIVRVAGIEDKFLGRVINKDITNALQKMSGYANPAGEGGEYETLVIDMPLFKKKLKISDFKIIRKNKYDATLIISRIEIC